MADPTPAPVSGPPPVPGYDTSAAPAQASTAQVSGGQTLQVGNYTLSFINGINPTDKVIKATDYLNTPGGVRSTPTYDTVGNVVQSFGGWSTDQFQKFRLQAYQAGLLPSKTASKAEVLVAWQTVVEEAVKQKIAPDALIASAVSSGGWNNIKPTIMPSDNGLAGTGNANSLPDQTTTQTTYTSYLDPATIQGAQADAWYRLMGRMPTQEEYQKFMNDVYTYQTQENTGKFETSQKGVNPDTGGTAAQNNIISQRGVGQRGLEFLAGNAAMANPDEGTYQATTTYFNAFMKALAGPAAGMSASGPTTTAP